MKRLFTVLSVLLLAFVVLWAFSVQETFASEPTTEDILLDVQAQIEDLQNEIETLRSELEMANHLITDLQLARVSKTISVTDNESLSLTLEHAEKFLITGSEGKVTVYIDQASAVDFPIGSEIHFYVSSEAGTTFTCHANVSIYSVGNERDLAIKGVATLKKISTDSWVLYGDITTYTP
jgi:prefoldin subunit 5